MKASSVRYGGKRKSLPQRIAQELKKNWGLYLLVSLPVLYLVIFRYIPMYGVQIAFKDYSPVRTFANSPFVGLKHFERFINNHQFKQVFLNTLGISLYSLATFPVPVILALLLNYVTSMRFKKTVQMVSYAPHFISVVVMVGILMQFLDARTGVLNQILGLFGVPAQNFMAKAPYFRSIYVWSGVWQGMGYGSIIYIAALSGVSYELHEAAIVDGANILKRIWHIDLPSILPTVSIMLILNCGSILSVGYEKIFLMQNSLNLQVSEIISTFVYKQGIQAALPQYSYATAIGLFISVINMFMLLIVNGISGKLSGNSLF